MEIKPKYSLHDGYSEGAHPAIIEAFTRTNLSQQRGYGDDGSCEDARQAIRRLIGADEASSYFTPGGTGANILSIASHLRPHEAVISTGSGHIVGKKAGAIEATGHQVLVEPSANGKLTPEKIQSAFHRSSLFAYQPKAKMVFISNATELLLLMDGARLDTVLASPKSDMTMRDVFGLADAFWIGGTKNCALLGEAVVIKDPSFGTQFPYHMNQRGALLAKGKVLGI
ncbi:hypothetical protein QQS21_004382 [Conoideocrella luteorostrata]|uniref:Aromatic amino acid beta-eliminating lyase/threonine aldolase domain-containing protein n=1 Tax=Conoideocrella luteorostrata TaxID=1105319 RepID=A0AAJ0FZW3_9HYPO|nr:hypothetical protein QQS21_004382 [Conoideocrella luteorostrata]